MSSEETITNRNEIVFLYDVKDANPNGDPFENKPRIDDETGLNMITDTRLKRTIRDYLQDFKNIPVFIAIKRKEDGTLESREERLKELKIERENKDQIFEKYIDLRLFGATIALERSGSSDKKEKGWSISQVGPVQFNLGRSLNKVKVETLKGTTVMPSNEGLTQGTFTESSIVHYSLICFHGLINENAAQYTRLTNNDLDMLFEGLWNGTKNLITRSKVGQQPRFLIRVIYKEKEFHIGDLHKQIIARYSIDDELAVRDIKEVILEISNLIHILKMYSDKIEKIQLKMDPEVRTSHDFKKELSEIIKIEAFSFD